MDANDISETESNGGTEVTIPEDEYKRLLVTRAAEKLTEIKTETQATIASDGRQYIYGVDYAVGDYVTVQNVRFGLTLDKIQLIGMIESFDHNGRNLTPTFKKA